MSEELGQPGQIIDGKYRIVRLLGMGGMGAVWEGENLRIKRRVAIKLLHSSVSSQAEVVMRFEREAQAAAMVGSDHICEVLDMGELPDATRYMVMEYLDGDTLSGLIKKNGRLTPAQSTPILLQVLEALGAAHAAGIIHRDLKPDNIFILPQKNGIQNFVKILDFGVSKFAQGGEAMNVTRAGAVVGTPYYMSPEQARGGTVDQRTDIYAIGVLLYQATTGQVPYQAETFNELLFKIVLEVAPPPQTYVPDLDPNFAAVIQQAMAREPDQRFLTCAQFRDALLAYQSARATPQPAYALPRRQGDPAPAGTQVLDLSQMPGGMSPSWPGMPPPDGTMPMGPGLAAASQTGAGGAMSPLGPPQSPTWTGVPGGAMAGAPAAPMATSQSWGHASSPGNMVKPRSKTPMVVGVVAAAALVGVGVAVFAFMMIGKPAGPKGAAATANASAAPAVSATASASAVPVTPSASASAVPVTPTAGASASAPPVDATPVPATPPVTTGRPALTGRLPNNRPPQVPVGRPTGRPGKGKQTRNDLGY